MNVRRNVTRFVAFTTAPPTAQTQKFLRVVRLAACFSGSLMAKDTPREPDQAHDEEVQERASPSGKIVYKAILHEADEELKRPSAALFWSGLAAGLSMGFSLVGEGLMRTYLPDAHW